MEERRSSRGARCAGDQSRGTICKRLGHGALLLVGTMVATAGLPATDPGSTGGPARLVLLHVVGDGVPEPIAGIPGDAARGRALILARDAANCTLCHAISDPAIRFSGNLGPS